MNVLHAGSEGGGCVEPVCNLTANRQRGLSGDNQCQAVVLCSNLI